MSWADVHGESNPILIPEEAQVMSMRSLLVQTKEEVVADNSMVAAESAEAAKAGKEVLERGGNAVDAAVATSVSRRWPAWAEEAQR